MRKGLDQERQSGRTTNQLRTTPLNGVFVWNNHYLDYPKLIARRIEREDIRVVGPDWLTSGGWIGLKLSALVTDHACNFTMAQWDGLMQARQRIVPLIPA